MGNLPGYRFSGMLLSETLRIVNSEYKYIEWIASARIIHLRSPKNFLPRNGRQVWLCLTFSWLLTTSDVPEYLYRTIVKESRKDQEQFLKESSKLALYSSNIPARQYDHLHMNWHSELVNHPEKNTLVRLAAIILIDSLYMRSCRQRQMKTATCGARWMESGRSWLEEPRWRRLVKTLSPEWRPGKFEFEFEFYMSLYVKRYN